MDSVFRETGYLHICVFKYFSDICGFLANIGKCSPFFLGGGVFLFVSFLPLFVGFFNFPWLDWEGIIIWDIMDYFFRDDIHHFGVCEWSMI